MKDDQKFPRDDLGEREREVMFEGATEAPFSGELLGEYRDGRFCCNNCGKELFDSDTKFDSGSGWPSFTAPVDHHSIQTKTDESHGMIRTEATCANCGAHLGHVFDDGPRDAGGQRYCVNSLSLKFDLRES